MNLNQTPGLLASTFKLELSTTITRTQTQDTLARFNLLDSGRLLSQPHRRVNADANNANTNLVRIRDVSTSAVSILMSPGAASLSTNTNTNVRTGTSGLLTPPPTSTGFLAPPSLASGEFLGTSAYLGRQYESRTRVHRAPRHAECAITCEDEKLGAVQRCHGGRWEVLQERRGREGEGDEDEGQEDRGRLRWR